ncbi:unnamed protein product [Lampetra fluviatilis]
MALSPSRHQMRTPFRSLAQKRRAFLLRERPAESGYRGAASEIRSGLRRRGRHFGVGLWACFTARQRARSCALVPGTGSRNRHWCEPRGGLGLCEAESDVKPASTFCPNRFTLRAGSGRLIGSE